MKQRILTATAIILIFSILAACSGPEEKKVAFYNKGKALYEKGDYVKAALEFKNAIQIDLKYADAYYMLGMVALMRHDYRGASGASQKPLNCHQTTWMPRSSWADFFLAEARLMRQWKRLNWS